MLLDNYIFELADKLKDLKDKKKGLEDEIKKMNEGIDSIDFELSQAMIEEEIQNFSRNKFTFYINTKTMASAVPDLKEDLYKTLKNEGFGDLVYETVNANSLSAFVKELILENDDQVPEWLNGLVRIYEKTSVGVRKG